MDAYSPFPIEEASEAIGFHKSRVPLDRAARRNSGRLSGFALQYWINVISYPLNIGGSPIIRGRLSSFRRFELTVLFAGLSGVVRHVRVERTAACRITRCSTCRQFAAVTRDKFFLCVEAADPKFDMVDTQRFMESLNPLSISEVPH